MLDHPAGSTNSCNKKDFEISKTLYFFSPYAHNHNFLAKGHCMATLKRKRQATQTSLLIGVLYVSREQLAQNMFKTVL